VNHKSILIKQDGFYLVDWDTDTNLPSSQAKINDRLSSYFAIFSEFDENLTIGTFLNLLGEFSTEVNAVFNGYLSGADFNLFLKEAEYDAEKPPVIDWVELAWKVRMIASTDMTIVDIMPNLLGITQIVGSESDVVTELDYVRLRDICQFKIVEQTALDIPDAKTFQIAVEAERRWTLFDIISGFLSEISKFGSPSDKEALLADLNLEAKMSFTELLEYVDEIENLHDEIEQDNTGDLLDDSDDD
jgi:hypothetical protein